MENEKRLIDANALMEHLTRCKEQGKGLFSSVCVAIKCFVDQMPTVDAVEVVHGHMVERIVDHEYPWYTVFDCSECGCSVEKWHNYCPNCGAKMDGDGNG